MTYSNSANETESNTINKEALEIELAEFINSISNDVIISNNNVVLTQSSSGRYQVGIFGTDNKLVIDYSGNIVKPVTDKRVNLIYQIIDTSNNEVVYKFDRNVTALIEGIYKSGGNACPNVIPSLREWSGLEGYFELSKESAIVANSEKAIASAQKIQTFIKEMTGSTLTVKTGVTHSGDIEVKYSPEKSNELGDEGYYLYINDTLLIEAATDAGMLYGGTSISQILYQDDTHSKIPMGICRDYPAYEVRSGMLDVGRQYMELDYVEEIAKYMAWFKMNELHLHINDNGGEYSSGFAVESKKYPALNNGSGKYVWTQEEYKQFQKNVKEFGVNIISEIDSPGHAGVYNYVNSQIINDGHLDLKNHYDESVKLVKGIFDEFLDGEDPVFQSAVFHIGTDESWVNTNENMRKYINEMLTYVKSKPNIDEVRFWGNLTIYSGEAKVTNDATIQIWDAPDQNVDEALEAGYNLINSTSSVLYTVPGNRGAHAFYFNDHRDPADIYDVWNGASDFDTHGRPEGDKYYAVYNIPKGHPQVKGAEYCIWNENAGGISDLDVFIRAKSYIGVVAEKCWFGDEDRFQDGASFVAAFDKVNNYAPNANPARFVEASNNVIACYQFEALENNTVTDSVNGYHATVTNGSLSSRDDSNGNALKLNGETILSLPFKSVGYPYTVDFDIYLDGKQKEGSTLFSGDDGAFYIDSNNYLSYRRGKYVMSFSNSIPENEWVHITILCGGPEYRAVMSDADTTNIYIGKAKASIDAGRSSNSALPTEKIGYGLVGYIDNLTIYNTAEAFAKQK